MAKLVSALDSITQTGENGCQEYMWSDDKQEKILQLSFQLIRTKDSNKKKILGNKYFEMIKESFSFKEKENFNINNVSFLYRLMLHTRDIIKGKGEYNLFYILLGEWVRLSELSVTLFTNYKEVKYIIDTIINMTLDSCVKLKIEESNVHPYGSWKDIKYFMNYMRTHLDKSIRELEDISAFKYCIKLMVDQLKEDYSKQQKDKDDKSISLLARWIPREKSNKFGWIAKYIAMKYYKDWIYDKASDETKYKKSVKKALTYYRKIISSLNETLNTVQIKQCGKKWEDIDFNNDVTSITLSKQKNAFNYVDKKHILRGEDSDRLKCKDNYTKYINECLSGKKTIKAARCDIVDMINNALLYTSNWTNKDVTLIETLNLQWETQGKQIGDLGNMIAMVDTSGSMNADNALQAAIGIGCRIAEKSKLGKRVLTFSKQPEWINLNNTKSLTEMVSIVKQSNWGMNTDFQKAMKLILDACIKADLSPSEVSDMVLVILSDMQIDQADNTDKNTMDKMIKKMFNDGGMKTTHKTPYNVPHILFWNLRSTKGFPSLSQSPNSSMMSGFSPILMNTFCEKGMEALLQCTPLSILEEQLNDPRYSWVTTEIEKSLIDAYILKDVVEIEENLEASEIDEKPKKAEETKNSGWFGFW